MRKRDKKTRIFVLLIVIALVAALVIPMLASAVSAAETGNAGQGVYIENVRITDMSLDEVCAAVDRKMAEYSDDQILLYNDLGEVSVPASSLGLAYANTDVAREAYSIGKTGNIYQRFLANRQMQTEPIILDLDLTVSPEDVRQVVDQAKATLDRDPVDTGLVREEDGAFSLIDKVDGVEVNSDRSAAALEAYLKSEWHGGEGGIATDYTTVAAVDRSEELSQVKDLLGTWHTDFDPSSENRASNIRLGAARLNGTVLLPGEEFNFQDIVGPFSKEAGYLEAGGYENGSIVDTYGGGICQVSSTLHMAVREAELEVTLRSSHTMTVYYLEPGMDAAIAEDLLNFCFVNSSDAPIYIEAIGEDAGITVSIYGKETRPENRTIAFESRILNTVTHGTQFLYKSDLPFGQIEVENGHDGISAELWKKIYINGEFDSEEKVCGSEYLVYPDRYYIGTSGSSQSGLNAVNEAIASGSVQAVYNAVMAYA